MEPYRSPRPRAPDLAIAELIVRFMQERVIPYYVDPITKQPTGKQENFHCRTTVDRLFGDLPANDFGPLCLLAVHKAMATGSWLADDEKEKATNAGRELGLARNTITTRKWLSMLDLKNCEKPRG